MKVNGVTEVKLRLKTRLARIPGPPIPPSLASSTSRHFDNCPSYTALTQGGGVVYANGMSCLGVSFLSYTPDCVISFPIVLVISELCHSAILSCDLTRRIPSSDPQARLTCTLPNLPKLDPQCSLGKFLLQILLLRVWQLRLVSRDVYARFRSSGVTEARCIFLGPSPATGVLSTRFRHSQSPFDFPPVDGMCNGNLYLASCTCSARGLSVCIISTATDGTTRLESRRSCSPARLSLPLHPVLLAKNKI